jgi:hypothetical protein
MQVKSVLIGGTGFKSAGSVSTASGARVGIPVASLEAIGIDTIRRSPLQLKAIDGWASPLGQELYVVHSLCCIHCSTCTCSLKTALALCAHPRCCCDLPTRPDLT